MNRAATDFWDDQTLTHEAEQSLWLSSPTIRAYVNSLIGDEANPRWPLEWFQEVVGRRRFRRALSIGCGAGALERSLVALGLCESIDAFDAGMVSIVEARREAIVAGFGEQIRYFVADFNRTALPLRTYDLVLCHQSLHHVEKLERLLRDVRKTLRSGGWLYLDEYIGPSRHEWNDAKLAQQRAFYEALPADARTRDTLYPPLLVSDPSEAIRSSHIIQQVSAGFSTVARRDYGGYYLAVVYEHVRWARLPEGSLQQVIALDRSALKSGRSLYAVLAAIPLRGWRGLAADMRYFIEPKVRYYLRHSLWPRVKKALARARLTFARN